MRKSLAVAIPSLFAVTVVIACSSNKPTPATPTTTSDAGSSDAAAVWGGDASFGATTPMDAGPATAPTFPTFFTNNADAGAAAPPLTDQALDTAINLAVTTASTKVAPKMDKEGQPGRATLKEGEHWGMVINLQPNRCYTIVANSPPGSVAQLDLKLLQLPLNIQAGSSAASDKATPVIGKGKDALCPLLPVAIPYKVDVVATKGAGRIGIHVFSRNK